MVFNKNKGKRKLPKVSSTSHSQEYMYNYGHATNQYRHSMGDAECISFPDLNFGLPQCILIKEAGLWLEMLTESRKLEVHFLSRGIIMQTCDAFGLDENNGMR